MQIKNLGVGLLNHRLLLLLVPSRTSILFSIPAVPTPIPTQRGGEFPLLHSFSSICYGQTLQWGPIGLGRSGPSLAFGVESLQSLVMWSKMTVWKCRCNSVTILLQRLLYFPIILKIRPIPFMPAPHVLLGCLFPGMPSALFGFHPIGHFHFLNVLRFPGHLDFQDKVFPPPYNKSKSNLMYK